MTLAPLARAISWAKGSIFSANGEPSRHTRISSNIFLSLFPQESHCTRLGSLFSSLLCKMDFSPDVQVIEPGLKNTVAVEVDFTSIRCFQKTIFLFGKQFGDARTGRTLMQFNGATLTARIVL